MINITRKNQKKYNAHYGAEINSLVKIGDNIINVFYMSITKIEVENQIPKHDTCYYIRECDLPDTAAIAARNLTLQKAAVKKAEEDLAVQKDLFKMYENILEEIIVGDKKDHIVIFFHTAVKPQESLVKSLIKQGDKLVHYGQRHEKLFIAIVEVPGTATAHIKKYCGNIKDGKAHWYGDRFTASPIGKTGYKLGEAFKEGISEEFNINS